MDVLIHELTHTFVNGDIARYDTAVVKHVEKIFPKVDSLMYAAAYGPDAVWGEWVTRLGSILYFQDHAPKSPTRYKYVYFNHLIRDDERQGFIWQERSVSFLENYTENRDVYKTFFDFVPQLVGYFGFIADNFDDVLTEYANRAPYVIQIYPAPHTMLDLSKDSVTITITFSENMGIHCEGFKPLMHNRDYVPKSEDGNNAPQQIRSFWMDDRNYVVKMATDVVKDAGIYGVKLYGMFMQDRFVHTIREDFVVEYELPNVFP
jgi:hypothetical protein